MTKAQRKKAERLMLKHLIDNQPKYKEIMDALIDNPNKDVKSIVQPIIQEELKKARMIGIEIGFQGAMIQAYEKVKDMQTADEIKACLRAEADTIRERMGLKSAFDEDGNLIMENEAVNDEAN